MGLEWVSSTVCCNQVYTTSIGDSMPYGVIWDTVSFSAQLNNFHYTPRGCWKCNLVCRTLQESVFPNLLLQGVQQLCEEAELPRVQQYVCVELVFLQYRILLTEAVQLKVWEHLHVLFDESRICVTVTRLLELMVTCTDYSAKIHI